uniref:Uncharacterized protein n=1 Tax=Aegilops tauschii TaxID=37682 RepID=M8BL99_AEGTA
MAPLGSNTRRALCLVALLLMSTTLSSCHAAGTADGSQKLCVAQKACKPKWSIEPWGNYVCKVYCGVRSFDEDKSHCAPDGSGFCCCEK